MVDATRFQFLLPEQHRRELAELEARTGFSRADLVRLAIGRLAAVAGAALENGDPKTTTKNHRGTRSQSVHYYDLVVGQMFAKNSNKNYGFLFFICLIRNS